MQVGAELVGNTKGMSLEAELQQTSIAVVGPSGIGNGQFRNVR